jgi:putative flippase GtrA
MRFLKFNGVGAIGFALQLGALSALLSVGVHYLAATAIAVELSVLNNFLWHERWTWRDRPAEGAARAQRLLRFHLLNGVVSIAGNVAVTALLVERFRIGPVLANVIAVLACGLVNFVASDRVVFEETRVT